MLRCLPSAQSRHIYALVRYNFSCADSRLTRADGGRTICLQCVLYNSWPTTLTLSRYLPTPTSPAYFFQPGCEIFTASRALKPHKAPRFIHRPLSHFPARSSLCRSRVLSGLPPNLFCHLSERDLPELRTLLWIALPAATAPPTIGPTAMMRTPTRKVVPASAQTHCSIRTTLYIHFTSRASALASVPSPPEHASTPACTALQASTLSIQLAFSSSQTPLC